MTNKFDDLQAGIFTELENKKVLKKAVELSFNYLDETAQRRPFPSAASLENARTDPIPPMPDTGSKPEDVVDAMNSLFSNACVNAIGGRYFGFVTGGSLPVSLAARWLADAWDQNAPLFRTSPAAAIAEDICEAWLNSLFGFPNNTVAGFVSGSSLAIYCGIAAARWRLLQRKGWDVNAQGLTGAPDLRIVAGRHAHATVVKTVTLLGLGANKIEWVDVDDAGCIEVNKVPALDDRTILLLQAGNVNGGGFDDFKTLCAIAKKAGAWTHVDGAFGLWAAAAKAHAHLTDGMEEASSWSCDAHKTLNTPYDCGVIFCSDKKAINAALHAAGSYLETGVGRDGMYFTPELSRRARAFEVWATLSYLGRQGVDDLVSLMCERAEQFAGGIKNARFELIAEPSFNQFLFAGENDEETMRVLRTVQEGGICWAADAEWHGRRVIRISVCSWATTEDDVNRSVEAFKQARIF